MKYVVKIIIEFCRVFGLQFANMHQKSFNPGWNSIVIEDIQQFHPFPDIGGTIIIINVKLSSQLISLFFLINKRLHQITIQVLILDFTEKAIIDFRQLSDKYCKIF